MQGLHFRNLHERIHLLHNLSWLGVSLGPVCTACASADLPMESDSRMVAAVVSSSATAWKQWAYGPREFWSSTFIDIASRFSSLACHSCLARNFWDSAASFNTRKQRNSWLTPKRISLAFRLDYCSAPGRLHDRSRCVEALLRAAERTNNSKQNRDRKSEVLCFV